MFGGKGMGGGSAGGSMLRSVGRAVTARTGVTTAGSGFQDSLSSSSTTTPTSPTSSSRSTHKPSSSSNHVSLSSSTSSPFSSHNNIPISAPSGFPTWPSLSQCDDFEWVSVDGGEDERPRKYVDDFVLGPVPSEFEVQDAVSALQQVFDHASYSKLIRDKFASDLDKDVADQVTSPIQSDLDWVEPSLHLCNSNILQPHESDRVCDAFHLLQTEPLVKRMVISLSSDKAVWNAVLNNEVVQELKESYYAVENNSSQSGDETCDDSNKATNFVRWIFDSTKAKVMEVIEKITNLVNEIFQSPDEEKTTEAATDPFQEKLKTSFMLSVMVLLIVVVTRAQRA